MASSENYRDLRQTISENVNLLYNKGVSGSLKSSFESGGEIHAILQILEEKKKRINEHQKNINSLEINNKETTDLTSQNKLELNEINIIQTQLNSLSSKLVEPQGSFTMQRIVDNFVQTLASGQEVQQGFWTTLFNTISHAFSSIDTASLQISEDKLNNFKNILEKEPENRYKLPNEKEIEPLEGKDLEEEALEQAFNQIKARRENVNQQRQANYSKIQAVAQDLLNDDDNTNELNSSNKISTDPNLAIEELAELLNQNQASELKILLKEISEAQKDFKAEYDSKPLDLEKLADLEYIMDASTDKLFTIFENLDELAVDVLNDTKILEQIEEFNSFSRSAINLGEKEVEFTKPFDFTVIENHLDEKLEQDPDLTSNTKTTNQSQEVQNPTENNPIIEQTTNNKINADKIPPAPPPPLKNEVIGDKKPIENKLQPKDLLSEIREKSQKVIKTVSLDQGDFRYVLLNSMSNVLGAEEKQSFTEKLLTGKSKEEQLNVLYSAMVDNKQELIKDLLNTKISVNTGTTVDEDGWDVDIMEEKKIFSAQDVEKVGDAVVITQDRKNGVETNQQQNITNLKEFIQNKEDKQQSSINKETILENDNKIPPPPPSLTNNIFQNKIKEERSKPNLEQKPSNNNLLDSIKQGVTLKKVENPDNYNMDDFIYQASKKTDDIKTLIHTSITNKFKKEIDYGDLLDDKSEKQQLDLLYTAVINGEKDKIEGIIEYAKDEGLKFVKKENIQNLYEAAMKISFGQSLSQKIITEKGCKVIAEEMGLKVNQTKAIDH